MKTATKPRRVNPLKNRDDMEVLIRGVLGQSNKAIADATGYTSCQIAYRLHKQGVKRADYRDGTSFAARNVLKNARTMAISIVKEELANYK